MTLKRSGPIKRKPAKRRAPGVGCQARGISGKTCRANAVMTVADTRYCRKHAADKLTGDAVKRRDGCCRSCGSEGPLDWAHVWRRAYMAIRWDLDNAVALCRACHTRFGNQLAEWEQWCRDQGIDWDGLRWRALNDRPMNPDDVIERLKDAA